MNPVQTASGRTVNDMNLMLAIAVELQKRLTNEYEQELMRKNVLFRVSHDELHVNKVSIRTYCDGFEDGRKELLEDIHDIMEEMEAKRHYRKYNKVMNIIDVEITLTSGKVAAFMELFG
jgi:hypothetical protein